MPEVVRPRVGLVKCTDGTQYDIRFVPTGERDAFMAVTPDGDPVVLGVLDSIVADALAPGQTITVRLRLR